MAERVGRRGWRRARLLSPTLVIVTAGCGRVPGLVQWYAHADERVFWYGRTSERVVALTIDDGPSPATDSILDVLAAYRAHATFFLIGSNVADQEAAVRRLVREGHEVGNHTMFDIPSAKLPSDTFRAHFARTDSILRSFDVAPVWFRPGSGRFNEPMLRFLCERGTLGALGEVWPIDTLLRSSDGSAAFIVERARPGSVIILHDGGARGYRTARALAKALPALERAGFRVVTLTELAGGAAGVAERLRACGRSDRGAAT